MYLVCIHPFGADPAVTIDRGAKQRIGGAGTATATEPTQEHKQYAIQGPTTYLCTEREQQLRPTTSLR